MKKETFLIAAILLIASYCLNAQVAINTDGSSADESAILDVKSTEKGFLPPRTTEVQMNAISNPAEGLIVYCTDCNPKGPYYFDGSNWLNFATNAQSEMDFSDVTNPTTGKTWMDRNLGASRVAQSFIDYHANGSLYQWGRGSDGHEIINWTSFLGSDGAEQLNETTSLSNSDIPGHGNFITGSSDWRSPQNDNLWQGVNGVNNPCPSGYRLPTSAEWDTERQSWSSNNISGAFDSPLKLTVAGNRVSHGEISNAGNYGYHWSSTVDGISSQFLIFLPSDAYINNFPRANGLSVRCIKD